MASVWRDGDNPIWRARYQLPNGKFTNRSTKEKNRAKAQKTADFWEEESKKIRKGVTNERRLLKAVSSMATEMGWDEIKLLSIKDTFQQYIDSKERAKRSEATLVKYKSVVKSLLKFLGDEKINQSINSLTRSNLELWRDDEIKSGKGGTTADQSLEIIKQALTFARKQGFLPDNPAEGIELIGEGAEQRERFTEIEIKNLYEKASDEWKGMILTGLWYGMRINDSANLQWGNVNFDENTITYIPTKTGRKKKVPVTYGLPIPVRKYLKELYLNKKKENLFIFSSLAGKKSGSGGGLSNAFNRLMDKANIVVPTGEKKQGSGRTFRKKGFHSLRHTMISRMTEAGIPEELGMAISIHASRAVHRRYVHFTREVQNSVFSRLSDFLADSAMEIEYYI